MPVYENERGTYIFNSKDLNMIEYIDQILDAGIDSLKIEGRMKTALYVATVARTYRKAIDDCKESVEKYKANMDYYKEEIAKCTYRQFTTGFYFGKTDETSQIYDSNTYIKNCTYIGIVQGHNDKGYALLEQKNKFSVGETIEVMIPDGTNKEVVVRAIEDEDGRADDYITKPFSPSELVARVKAHLNRYQRLVNNQMEANDIIVIRGLKIDKTARRVYLNGEEKVFTTKEFDLLTFLAGHPNRVFTKEELFNKIWDMESLGDIATVTVHIKKIREKIEVNTAKPQYIETIWGVGYRFKM